MGRDKNLLKTIVLASLMGISCLITSCVSTEELLKKNPAHLVNVPPKEGCAIDGVWGAAGYRYRIQKGRMWILGVGWPMVWVRDIERAGPGKYRGIGATSSNRIEYTIEIVSSDRITLRSDKGDVIYFKQELDDTKWFLAELKKMPQKALPPAASLKEVTVAIKPEFQKDGVYIPLGHAGKISSVAFSPNGRYVITGGYDKNLMLWDVATKRKIRTSKGHNKWVESVAVSPNGRYIISSCMGENPKLWDISTGKVVRIFHLPPPTQTDRTTFMANYIYSVAFSPNGRYILTGGLDRILRLWDVDTGMEIRSFKGHTKAAYRVAFSPDGRYALSYSWDNTLKLWNVTSGKEVRTFKGHFKYVKMAFTQDGCHVLTGSEGSLRLWDVDTGEEVKRFKGDVKSIKSVAFSQDGRYVLTGGTDTKALKLWDVATGTVLRTFKGNFDYNHPRAFSPDNQYALSQVGRRLILWDVATGNNLGEFEGGRIHFDPAIAFSPDGKWVLSGSEDKTLTLWDITTGNVIRTFKGHSKPIYSVTFSPDGRYALSGSFDKTLRLWDLTTAKELKNFEHPKYVRSVAISPDGRYALSGGGDRVLRYWDLTTGKEVRSFKGHAGSIYSVAFSPNGRYALSGGSCGKGGKDGDKTMYLWDLVSSKRVRAFRDQPSHRYVAAVAFSPDGRYALSGEWDKTVKIWDVATGYKLRTLTGHTAYVERATFSPEGKMVISGGYDKVLRLWNMATGKEIKTFTGHSGKIYSLLFSPDGRYVLSGSTDKTTRLWDTATGKEIAQRVHFSDGEWIYITPEGFYNCSPKGAKYLRVTLGKKVYRIDQFYGALYRPDLVLAKIDGDSEGLVRQAASRLNLKKMLAGGAPPQVAFVAPEFSETLTKRDIELTIELSDQGGGIGKTEWKINGMTVGIDKEAERGILVKKGGTQAKAIRLKKLVTLSPGENYIQVIAYNAKNEIASYPAELRLTLKDEISTKPALYLVSIGVNRYRDKALWLKYSVADAKAIASALENQSRPIFTKIVVTAIFDGQATYEEIDSIFKKVSKKAKTHDVFVLYLAGHGVTKDGRYHFLPYNFRYRNEDSIRQSAITQDHLQEWLSLIKARKSLVLMDTCNSGSFTRTQGRQRGIAEKTAINKLTRATGRATIVAAKDDQPAMEGYKGHGVFTYVLLKALQEADKNHGNRDRQTSIFEISSYVDEKVPEITFKAFGYEQVPQLNMQGSDFPIAIVR